MAETKSYRVPGTWAKSAASPFASDRALRRSALNLIRAGSTQSDVARVLGCTDRTVLRWIQRDDEAWNVWQEADPLRNPGPTHGAPSTYNQGCRCRECTDANTLRHRRFKASHGLLTIPLDAPIYPPGFYPRENGA